MPSKPIGQLNGIWGLLLKVMLVTFVPWAVWSTRNQILDNQFRGKGERWTSTDAEAQTRAIVSEVMLAWKEALNAHASKPGHDVMEVRVTFLESLFPAICEEKRERTEVLTKMQEDIRTYLNWMKSQNTGS